MSNLFKLYRKGTDGTPTLFMPDQTTIGSSLNTTDLSTDLASIASKEYIANEVDKFSRSSLAGKVDSYEDLPNGDVRVGTMYLVGTEGNLEEYIFNVSDPIAYPLTGAAFRASSYRASPNAYPPSNLSIYESADTSPPKRWMANPEGSSAVGQWCQMNIPSEVLNMASVYITAIGPQSVTSHMGASSYINYDVVGVKSDGTISEVIDSIVIKRYSKVKVDVSNAVADGYTSIRFIATAVSNTYLIMDTLWLEYSQIGWERMGTIRQSDVDLSGYTTTEGMMGSITDSNDVIDTNIETMRTDIQSYLDTLEQEINGSMGELPLDGQFQNNVPTEWDSKLSDRAMLFVIEPDTIPYTAPELRDGDGVPFVDEYAVRTSSSLNHEQYPAHEATYAPDVLDEHNTWSSANTPPPHYYYMTFKEPMRATHLFVKNRYILSNNIYAPKLFVIEGKTSSGEWYSIHTCHNLNAASNAEYEFSFENEIFYQEYRLKLLESHGGNAGYNYVCLNVARLSGEIKKQ